MAYFCAIFKLIVSSFNKRREAVNLHILNENQTLADDFKGQHELIKSAIIELKKHATRLTENF